jgi:ribosomal protein S14
MDSKIRGPYTVAAYEGRADQAPPDCNKPQPPSTARLIARRTAPKPGRAHVYLYDVEFDGELIVTGSVNPSCDLARALLKRSFTGKIAIMDSRTGKHRSTIDVEGLARLTVRETAAEGPRFIRWKPLKGGDGSPWTSERGQS